MYGSAKVCLAVDYAIWDFFLAIFLAFFFETINSMRCELVDAGTMVVPIYERGQVQL